MQLGMVGLGRMGANLSRRLMRAGHEVVAYDVSPEAVEGLAGEGAVGASSLEDFVAKLTAPRAALTWCRPHSCGRPSTSWPTRWSPATSIIDGGNSYYRDDIQRAGGVERTGHPLRRRRHERRRLRARARVLPDDRRRATRSSQHLDPIFATIAPGRRRRPRARPGAPASRARPSRATCTAGRTARATS